MTDFAELKQKVSIEQAAQFLGLQLKKEPSSLRCTCPVHGGDARSLAITPARSLFYCMASKQGGSCLDLVAHVRQVSLPEAANLLAQHFRLEAPTKKAEAATNSPGLHELDYLDPLAPEIEALGISPATADMVGMGLADKGYLRGRIGVPVRTPTGELLGYYGIAPGADVIFHKSIEEQATNIVAFKKPA